MGNLMNILFVAVLGILFFAANLAYVGSTNQEEASPGTAAQDGPSSEIVRVQGVDPPRADNSTAPSPSVKQSGSPHP